MNKYLAALPILFVCTTLQAAQIQIKALPTETSGGFSHNLFHDSSTQRGTSGATLAWFDLGAGFSYWDPDTGDFNLNINLYSDSGLNNFIGTAVGTSNDLLLSNFGPGDGGVIGNISWDFDATLNATGNWDDTTMWFFDRFYAVSGDGYVPNSVTATSMTLWGSDCTLNPSSGICLNFDNTLPLPLPSLGMGVDFVATFVPVPAAVWLFGSGLLALVGISRRKARHS